MKSWTHWPYWLKGGVIGGGSTLLSVLLGYSCEFFLTGDSSLLCGAFIVISPIYPVSWLMYITGPIWGPIFHYDYTWLFAGSLYEIIIISVIFWFIVCAVIGALVSYIKIKKSQQ